MRDNSKLKKGRLSCLPFWSFYSCDEDLPALASTAAAATAAVTTATAATAAKATTTAATATGALSGTRLVYSERPALELFAVGLFDGRRCILFGNVNESEAASLNDAYFGYGSPSLKISSEVVLGCAVRQVAYVQ